MASVTIWVLVYLPNHRSDIFLECFLAKEFDYTGLDEETAWTVSQVGEEEADTPVF